MKRGTPLLIASYLVTIGSAYGIFVALSRLLTTAEFGEYGVVNAALTLLNTVLAAGTTQAVSRFVASSPDDEQDLRRRVLGYQTLLALVATAGLAALAPVFAWALRDDGLTRYFLLAALVPGVYSITAVNIGALNGIGRFGAQGALNLIISVARLVLIVTLVALGFGLSGALIGILLAALLTLSMSFLLVARRGAPVARPSPRSGIPLTARDFLRLLSTFVGTQLLLQLVLAADLLLVKRLSPVEAADTEAGLYVAAQTIARIPYFLLLGVSQVAFSKVAREVTRPGGGEARRVSGLVITLLVVALLGMVAITVPLAEPILLTVYPERFRDGADALGLLLLASSALALGDSCQTMLSGAKGPRTSAVILGLALVTEVGVGILLIPRVGLRGAAIAALSAAAVTFALALVGLAKTVGTRLRLAPIMTGAALAAGLFVASTWVGGTSPTRPLVIAFVAGGYLLFAALIAGLFRSEVRELLG